MTLTKSQRQQMRGLRSGICACQGRGYFNLAGKRTPCPSCAAKAPGNRPEPEVVIQGPKAVVDEFLRLSDKLAKARQKASRLASTNRKMKWALRDMVTVAETAGLDLNPGRKGWRIKARKR
jgi:hypothetical protein